MASLPGNQTDPTRNARVRAHLERLADDVARIEFSYPAANLGLADVCRDALALVGSAPLNDETDTSPTGQSNGDHAIELLEAQKELGLVPRHEYRRRRRELSRTLRQTPLGQAPVLQRFAQVGSALLDGLDEGLDMLSDFTERFNQQRLGVRSLEEP